MIRLSKQNIATYFQSEVYEEMFIIFDSLLKTGGFKVLKSLANVLKTKHMTKYITPDRIIKMQLS